MALALGNLIQITDQQSYLGQELLNIYYYLAGTSNPDGVAALESLADFFNATLLPAVTSLQVDSLNHFTRQYKNLSNGVDFFVDTTVQPGQIAADTVALLPSYVSLGFMLVRSSLVTRNGFKRFGGLHEGQITGNEYAGSMTPIHGLEDVLAQHVITLSEDEFDPVIVKRPIPEPGTEDAIVNIVASAQFRLVGTQNSRKAGRGI